jgi:nucleoside-diphosphate-sugar epimerase
VGTTRDWRGRKVLITGATGFIGRHLVEQGLRTGAMVITNSRSPAQMCNASAHIMMDLGNRAEVLRVIRELKPAAIMHAASAGVFEKVALVDLLRTNVIGTDNLLAAADSLPERPTVVIAGSGYEYAAQSRPLTEDDPVFPTSPYGISKAAAAFCAAIYAKRMPVTVLRIFNVYGPGERLPRLLPYIVENAKLGNVAELTACEQVRDFVFVKDVATLFWRALERSPQDRRLRILNVGSGSPAPLKRFVTIMLEVLHEKGLDPEVKFGARPYRVGEPMYYAADITRLLATLGHLPRTTLDAGVRQSVEAML